MVCHYLPFYRPLPMKISIDKIASSRPTHRANRLFHQSIGFFFPPISFCRLLPIGMGPHKASVLVDQSNICCRSKSFPRVSLMASRTILADATIVFGLIVLLWFTRFCSLARRKNSFENPPMIVCLLKIGQLPSQAMWNRQREARCLFDGKQTRMVINPSNCNQKIDIFFKSLQYIR